MKMLNREREAELITNEIIGFGELGFYEFILRLLQHKSIEVEGKFFKRLKQLIIFC